MNPYEELNVDPDADDETIKKAYRKKAREFHPDVNKDPEAQKTFQDAAEAYSILSDPQKRLTYDQTGKTDMKKDEVEIQDKIFITFFHVLTQHSAGAVRVDVVKEMKKRIKKEIQSEQADMKWVQKRIDFLKKFVGRLHRKGKENPLVDRIQCQIASDEAENRKHDIMKRFLGRVMKELANYSFDPETGEMESRPIRSAAELLMGHMGTSFIVDDWKTPGKEEGA